MGHRQGSVRRVALGVGVFTLVACGASVLDGSGFTQDAQTVEDVVNAAMSSVCDRLHGDCSDVCDSEFSLCFSDAGSCTQNYARAFLEDFQQPVASFELARSCIEDIEAASCFNLQPRTFACDFAITDSCPGDSDGFGPNYSPLSATPIEMGQIISLDVCDGVDEFLTVTLQEGERPQVERENIRVDVEWYRLENPQTDPVLIEAEDLDDLGAPRAGEYVILIEPAASFQGIRIALGSDLSPAPVLDLSDTAQ